MTRPTTVTDTFECEVPYEDQVYLCNVKAVSTCTYAPGHLGGPPEDCYPDESEQETTFEILDCTLEGNEIQLNEALIYELTPLLPVEWMESALWDHYMREDC